MTNLCVFNNRLPQGAPTSPKLANLICARLDARIHGYAGPKGITYTRYADDLTLSAQSPSKIFKAKDFLGVIIQDEDFKLNTRKTKICGTMRRKEVTGLVIAENKVSIGRKKYRKLRVKIHRLFTGEDEKFSSVNGYLAFVYGVDKLSYKRLHAYINKLKIKYPAALAIRELHAEKN